MDAIFETRNFTHLTVTARKRGGACGALCLIYNQCRLADAYYKYEGYETYTLPLIPGTMCHIEWNDLTVSFAYVYREQNLMEEGVTFLEFREDGITEYDRDHIKAAYSQSYRNQFHLSPFTGWMNDPNGLCWYQGYYHLFYQYNPNSDHWGNMHWGHAVSRDLIRWIHLPVVFYPQIELLDNDEFRGGAFSGSAVVEGERMQLFLTRHFGRQDRSWQRQWQVRSESPDGINFAAEEPCIWGTPEGVFYDFRDPKVISYKGKWLMVVGGTHFHQPAVLWYLSDDLKHWEYQGVLFQETDPQYGICECPDFFSCDGHYVLIAGFMYADTGSPLRRDTRYYVGNFDGKTFVPVTQGLVDYGRDFYAMQSMEHEGRRLAFGWNTTGDDVYVAEQGSANGTASLPRELSLKNGQLFSYPAVEVKKLHDKLIFEHDITEAGLRNISPVLAEGPYCLELTGLPGVGELSGELVYNEDETVAFQLRNGQFSLKPVSGSVCQFALAEPVTDLTVYVDRSLVEIYINRGMYTCTRRFYLEQAVYAVRNLILENGGGLARLFGLRSIWETWEV